MQSDAELVALVLDGDVAAFGTLIDRYEYAVLSIALQILRDRELARDAAQEAFWKAYQKLSTLNQPNDFGSWVFQITRNHSHSALRQLHRSTHMLSLDGVSPLLEQNQTRIDTEPLMNAVHELPDNERQVILMRFFDGLSVAEISEALERPVGTVTKQLSRAYGHLHSMLSECKFKP